MGNRFTTCNQWFKENIETSRTPGWPLLSELFGFGKPLLLN